MARGGLEKVLDAARCVFWREGYEGASHADLVEAAGVERPALYSAFGNKEDRGAAATTSSPGAASWAEGVVQLIYTMSPSPRSAPSRKNGLSISK